VFVCGDSNPLCQAAVGIELTISTLPRARPHIALSKVWAGGEFEAKTTAKCPDDKCRMSYVNNSLQLTIEALSQTLGHGLCFTIEGNMFPETGC